MAAYAAICDKGNLHKAKDNLSIIYRIDSLPFQTEVLHTYYIYE